MPYQFNILYLLSNEIHLSPNTLLIVCKAFFCQPKSIAGFLLTFPYTAKTLPRYLINGLISMFYILLLLSQQNFKISKYFYALHNMPNVDKPSKYMCRWIFSLSYNSYGYFDHTWLFQDLGNMNKLIQTHLACRRFLSMPYILSYLFTGGLLKLC